VDFIIDSSKSAVEGVVTERGNPFLGGNCCSYHRNVYGGKGLYRRISGILGKAGRTGSYRAGG